jgi:uncharacterized protein (TIGR00369 family)
MEISNDTTAWEHFLAISPYTTRMGITAVAAEEGGCTLALPFSPDLVGDPDSGVLHGGAITALVDTAFGFAVFFRVRKFAPMATLDLRVSYLRAARPGVDVHARAYCYKLSADLAFVRGDVFEDNADEPFATCVGTFMFTSGQPAFTAKGSHR